MFAISAKFDKLLKYNRHTFIPALIFAFAIIGFLSKQNYQESTISIFHWCFYILSFISLMILLYFNKSKPVFFVISITLSYILINYLKKTLGINFVDSEYYLKLSILLPVNLALFYFIPTGKLLNKQNLYFLFLLLIEVILIEKLNITIPAVYAKYASFGLFSAMCIIMFFKNISIGKIGSVYLFYSSLCLAFGFYFSDKPNALPLFFFSSSLITFTAICLDLYFSIYKDELTELSSRQSFMMNSTKFPLKYSLGLVAIDEYDNIKKAFGKNHINDLTQMVTNIICDFQEKENIYRYSEDEFVIIFKNESNKEGHNHLEEIRRKVASSNFALRWRKKPMKLTISASVSEKKRSDANAYEVLIRTHKALQKTYKFTQNVTTKV